MCLMYLKLLQLSRQRPLQKVKKQWQACVIVMGFFFSVSLIQCVLHHACLISF